MTLTKPKRKLQICHICSQEVARRYRLTTTEPKSGTVRTWGYACHHCRNEYGGDDKTKPLTCQLCGHRVRYARRMRVTGGDCARYVYRLVCRRCERRLEDDV